MTTNERKTMHAIVSNHPAVKAARSELAETQAACRSYRARIAAASEQHKREQQAALDRGETHSPRMEVIPDHAVENHLAHKETQAELALEREMQRLAKDLIIALEQREAELLEAARKGAKPTPLVSAAAELEELRTTRSALLQHHRRASRNQGEFDWPPVVKFDASVEGPITAGVVLDAAMAGRSLLGARASYDPGPAPEPQSMVHVESYNRDTGVTSVIAAHHG